MPEDISIETTAAFNEAMRVLKHLVAQASRRAADDPAWVGRRDELRRLRDTLDQQNLAEILGVLERYGPEYRTLTNPR